MVWLFFSVLLDFGFVQFFKYGQRRGDYALVLVSTNYLVVAATLAAYLVATDSVAVSALALQTGLVTGVLFILSMSTMTYALQHLPVGSVTTSFRIAIAIPVALGIWLWDEPIDLAQIGGISLALAALTLMTSGGHHSHHVRGIRALGLLLGIFVLQGISHTCLRSVHYNGLDPEFLHVLMVTGATAGLLGYIYTALKRRPVERPAVTLGISIGLYNTIGLSVILTALSVLPGTVFYPAMGCSVVLLDNLFAHFYWREYLTRRAGTGVAIAVLSIFLII